MALCTAPPCGHGDLEHADVPDPIGDSRSCRRPRRGGPDATRSITTPSAASLEAIPVPWKGATGVQSNAESGTALSRAQRSDSSTGGRGANRNVEPDIIGRARAHATAEVGVAWRDGSGGGGIRTLEEREPLRAFEARALGRTMRLHQVVPRPRGTGIGDDTRCPRDRAHRHGQPVRGRRRSAKKSLSNRPHCSALTSVTTSARWFSLGSSAIPISDRTAPALGSVAP